MYIDIHNHILYGVDDGPQDPELSGRMLEDAAAQGACEIIFTPHFRHEMFDYPLEKVNEHYEKLAVRAERLGIRTHLGCEYHVCSDITDDLSSGRVHTLADTAYVLTEYSHDTPLSYISEYTDRLYRFGYRPVVAHIERYMCFRNDPDCVRDISDRGALIQINAGSVLGQDGLAVRLFCKKLLQNGLADIVASDAHDMTGRRCLMGECRKKIENKFGSEYAQSLFYDMPMKILGSK